MESPYNGRDLAGESPDNIGPRMKAARTALHLTQQELGEIAGVPLNTIKKYEGSHSVPGGDALAGYLRAGVNVNWLLNGQGPMLLKDQVPAGALDVEELRAVMIGVDEALSELRRQLAPDKKFELVMALYELSRETEVKPSRATVIRLVKTAA